MDVKLCSQNRDNHEAAAGWLAGKLRTLDANAPMEASALA